MLRRNSFNKGEFLALFEMVAAVMVAVFLQIWGIFFWTLNHKSTSSAPTPHQQ